MSPRHQAVHDPLGVSARDATRRAVLAAVVVVLPVAVGLVYAAAGSIGLVGPGADGPSLGHVVAVLTDRGVWRGLAWTTYTAAMATALGTIAAIIVAVVYRGPGLIRRMVRDAALAPLPVPYVVAASIAILCLGQSGMLARIASAAGVVHSTNAFPALVLDRPGIGFILTFAWKEGAFLAFVAWSVLATHGTTLEEAARTLGAAPLSVFWRVTLPILWRGLAPAAVLVFVFIAGSYEAAALLGPSNPLPYPVAIYERYGDLALSHRGEAFVLTVLGLVFACGAVVPFARAQARAEGDRP